MTDRLLRISSCWHCRAFRPWREHSAAGEYRDGKCIEAGVVMRRGRDDADNIPAWCPLPIAPEQAK